MLSRVRHEHILREVQLYGSIRSAEMAEKLGVNSVTIRRDIAELEAAGLLARVHGGALAVEKSRRRPERAKALVGLVVPSTTAYYPEVVRGMEVMAAGRGVRLVLGVSQYDAEVEEARVERLLALGVSGLVFAPTKSADPSALAQRLDAIPVPVVLLERVVDDLTNGHEFDFVRSDHAHGAALAVRHLARLGHRRIGLGVFDRTPTAPWVRAGYAQAVEHFGMEIGPVTTMPKGEDDPTALSTTLQRWLRECTSTQTTCVLVHTDFHAAQLVEVAEAAGVRVPDDLAVVAYDDELAEFAHVPLTAVTPPRLEVGQAALSLLIDRIEQPAGTRAPVRHLQLLPRLTVRDSCGG